MTYVTPSLRFFYSLLRCGLRNLFTLRIRDNGTTRFVCRPSNWRISRPHNRPISIKKFRTKTTRTITVVDCVGGVRCVYNIRHPVQRDESNADGE